MAHRFVTPHSALESMSHDCHLACVHAVLQTWSEQCCLFYVIQFYVVNIASFLSSTPPNKISRLSLGPMFAQSRRW